MVICLLVELVCEFMDKDQNRKIVIFTDGASRGNPGPGGWGAIVITPKKVIELGGREDRTTNNRMELQAVISALNFLDKKFNHGVLGEIVIHTDSSYVLRGATEWLAGWERKNWQTTTKKDVLNKDLWQELSTVMFGKNIGWRLVSGHVGVSGNERADVIATSFADSDTKTTNYLYSGSRSNYKINILDTSHDAGQKEKRSSSKNRSRVKAYSYVSKVRGEIQTHKLWAECEKRVNGVAGALYKKALNSEEEQIIIKDFEGRR